MNPKMTRFNKIKSFLRLQSAPLTVSEIHEGLTRRLGLEISRKTVERDLLELSESLVVTMTPGVPSRFCLSAPSEIELVLKVEEIKYVLEHVSSRADLYQKIRSILEASGVRV